MNEMNHAANPNPDTGSFGWAVLGFFIPLVGLILFLVWRTTKPASARQSGIGALVGVIFSVVFSIISAATGAALIATL